VIRSRDLTSRPLKRRLLGEDIVFWRDGGRAHAIAERCPHRGASLANGHCRFPGSGTLSCPYHGWTFNGSGELVACIQEGPDSVMPGRVRAKAYPVEERASVVWVWIGDTEPVPIDEDLPACMKLPGAVNLVHFTPVWRTNWAFLFDNFLDRLHSS
jgi:phenylpropionate dioxygenase-like ring-hydroxylating dioxygenase large terminal subunit